MRTLNEAKTAARALKAKHIRAYPRLIVWIEKESDFKIFYNLSGRMQPNPLQKQRIYV
ncbi:MAG TPA: hypothetical protein VN922_17060 [Bacteroidia bacterium]|nr:hypothetical protein [Bacteroidia bacterium]